MSAHFDYNHLIPKNIKLTTKTFLHNVQATCFSSSLSNQIFNSNELEIMKPNKD